MDQVQGEAHDSSVRPRRLTRPYVVSLCFVIVLQLLNINYLGPLGQSIPQVQVAARTSTIPYTDMNPYGANTFLSKEVEDWKREKTVQMMSEAGLGWMKQQFPWSEIEPKQGRFWDDKYNQNSWDKYDRIVDLAEKYGVRIIARLDNTPEWARGQNTTPQTPPESFERFADFVAIFIEHYQGRVQYLQIWNEPNLRAEWGDKLDANSYATMLKIVYTKAKAVDPNIVILSAPLAQTLETGDRGLNDLEFLQQLYNAGFAQSFDILMANGYGFNQPPTAAPDPQVLNLRRVELLRQIMERNNDGAKPIWLNEYAWNASPASIPAEDVPWQRVTEEQQANYTVEGIRYMRENWPWLGVVNIWYFRQVGDVPPTKGEFYFRMVEPEWNVRPIYTAVAHATEAQRLAIPGHYPSLSPALTTKGRWVIGNQATAAQPTISSTRAGDTVEIRFQGNRLQLEADVGPQGGRLGVLIDGTGDAVQALPKDDKGWRYLDFRAATAQTTTLTVVSGLDPLGAVKEHRVLLKTLPTANGSPGTVTLRSIEVAHQQSSPLFLIVSIIAGVAIILLLIPITRSIIRLVRRAVR